MVYFMYGIAVVELLIVSVLPTRSQFRYRRKLCINTQPSYVRSKNSRREVYIISSHRPIVSLPAHLLPLTGHQAPPTRGADQ